VVFLVTKNIDIQFQLTSRLTAYAFMLRAVAICAECLKLIGAELSNFQFQNLRNPQLSCRGLSPADAELNYILKAIHLDGFSEELLPAKVSVFSLLL